jgi:hypothetical protein
MRRPPSYRLSPGGEPMSAVYHRSTSSHHPGGLGPVDFNTPANKAKDGFSVSGTSRIANSGGNTFTCITETPAASRP